MRFAAVVCVLIGLGSCSTGTSLSAEEAKDSMCFHIAGLGAAALSDDDAGTERFSSVLEVDARLLQDAGEKALAAQVRDAAEALRSGAGTEVSVYLRQDITPAQKSALESVIAASDEVASWRFVSQEQALEEFSQEFADKPELYEDLKPGDLPATFRLRTAEKTNVEELASYLGTLPGVDETRFAGQFGRLFEAFQELREPCGLPLLPFEPTDLD